MKKIIRIAFIFATVAFVACNKAAEESAATEETTTETAETVAEQVPQANSLTEEEKNEGWMLLFDGTSAEGWRGFGKEEFPEAWKITEAGELYFAASEITEETTRGDIIYDKEFANFHFKLEWKIAEAGNSGIFYLGKEGKDYIWMTAPEMQVLDNVNHPDAAMGKDGNRKAGSLYDLYPANPQNANPPGEWNSAEVIHNNGKVQHIQNGEVVVEYEIGTDKWKQDVAASKFPGLNEDWVNIASSGYFGLQDHGDNVWFRNLKVKEM